MRKKKLKYHGMKFSIGKKLFREKICIITNVKTISVYHEIILKDLGNLNK